ncbi:hypothetical protein ACP70R_000628 [Stipagrostis hirtigluma subsp. patula]
MGRTKMSSMTMVMAALVLGMAPFATAASGIATFYTHYTRKPTNYSATSPHFVGLLQEREHGHHGRGGERESFWNSGAACGRCYRVRCPGAASGGGSGNPCTGGSVAVKIVDECASSDGCQSTIDLSKQLAFAKIANLDAGEVKVTFNPTLGVGVGAYHSHTATVQDLLPTK